MEDLIDVSEWLDADVEDLVLDVRWEPIEKFLEEIKSMHATYEEFPEDAERTKRILRHLKNGADPLPMYVARDDEHNFVMEGRHRMVAFFLHGMKKVPVCYVSVAVDDRPLEEAIVKVPQHWIDKIAERYMPVVKYAYVQAFGESEEEKQEMAQGLGYVGSTVDRDHDIYSNPVKLTVIVPSLPLRDDFNVTYIDHDTSIMLVATYNLDTGSKGSFTPHPKHGNLLIINVAAPVAEGAGDAFNYEDELKGMEAVLKEVIEHELVHMIQHEFGDKRQLKKNAEYHTNRDEYHKSPVEFNAQIISFVREFEAKLNRLSQHKKSLLGYQNILNAVYKSLGDLDRNYIETGNQRLDRKADAIFINLVMPNEFMTTLRDKKPKQWKRAVKAVVKYFEKKLEDKTSE